MSAVCVLKKLALSISIIHEIGNIKSIVEIFCKMIISPIETAMNTVLMNDSNYRHQKINKQSKNCLFQVVV